MINCMFFDSRLVNLSFATQDVDGAITDNTSASVMTINGNRAVIGYATTNTVRVFERDVSDDWILIQTITAIGGNFGFSVDMPDDGSWLAVGQYGNNEAHLYEWDPIDGDYDVTTVQTLTGLAGDNFGISVCFSRDGSIFAVGANSEGSFNEGKVRTYTYSASWIIQETIDNPAYVDGLSFGRQIAFDEDGDVLAVCMDEYVRMYEYSGGWVFDEQFQRAIGSTPGNWGFGISLSRDGTVMCVGDSVSALYNIDIRRKAITWDHEFSTNAGAGCEYSGFDSTGNFLVFIKSTNAVFLQFDTTWSVIDTTTLPTTTSYGGVSFDNQDRVLIGGFVYSKNGTLGRDYDY